MVLWYMGITPACHAVERDSNSRRTAMKEFMFKISAVFDGETIDDVWDEWVQWLSEPRHIEDGTEVTESE